VPNLDDKRALLLGTWWRTPELDTADEAVYRKEGVPLPPARGRNGFTLNADGSAALIGPDAADRSARTPATWSLDANGKLQVKGATVHEGSLAAASLSADRMALRK